MILYNNKSYPQTIGMNMSEKNRFIPPNHMGSPIDEELERALKLSLNPEEQTTKEQRDFVKNCH